MGNKTLKMVNRIRLLRYNLCFIQSDGDYDDGDDGGNRPQEEKELARNHTEDKDAVISQTGDGVQCLESGTLTNHAV